MHDKIHGREIVGEWKAILHELEDGKPHRPNVRTDSIFLPRYAFGLEGKGVGGSKMSGNKYMALGTQNEKKNQSRTAMYLVVPVNVPA